MCSPREVTAHVFTQRDMPQGEFPSILWLLVTICVGQSPVLMCQKQNSAIGGKDIAAWLITPSTTGGFSRRKEVLWGDDFVRMRLV